MDGVYFCKGKLYATNERQLHAAAWRLGLTRRYFRQEQLIFWYDVPDDITNPSWVALSVTPAQLYVLMRQHRDPRRV